MKDDDLRFGPLTSRSIHLCIDMQMLFAPGAVWATPWMAKVLPVVLAIADRHVERTVFTRFVPPLRAENMPGTWRRFYDRWRDVVRSTLDPECLELMPGLRRMVPPAEVIDRPGYSGFTTPTLSRRLQERNADALVITGAESDVCVLATALSAVDRGYRVVLVTDAICSSSDAGHDAILDLYRGRFTLQIETATAERVLAGWRD